MTPSYKRQSNCRLCTGNHTITILQDMIDHFTDFKVPFPALSIGFRYCANILRWKRKRKTERTEEQK